MESSRDPELSEPLAVAVTSPGRRLIAALHRLLGLINSRAEPDQHRFYPFLFK
jgi:hypothetical protein